VQENKVSKLLAGVSSAADRKFYFHAEFRGRVAKWCLQCGCVSSEFGIKQREWRVQIDCHLDAALYALYVYSAIGANLTNLKVNVERVAYASIQ
jgi:hypothetical protein